MASRMLLCSIIVVAVMGVVVGECVEDRAKCRDTLGHTDCCDSHVSCADGYRVENTSQQCGYGGEGFRFHCCKPEVDATSPKVDKPSPAAVVVGKCVHDQAKCRDTWGRNDCCDSHVSCADGYKVENTSQQCGYGGEGFRFRCCKPEVDAASPKVDKPSPNLVVVGKCVHDHAKCRDTWGHDDCCDVGVSWCADGYKVENTSQQCGYGGEGLRFHCCKPEVDATSQKADTPNISPTILIFSTVGIVALIIFSCTIARYCGYCLLNDTEKKQKQVLLVAPVAPLQAQTDTIGAALPAEAQDIETPQAVETNAGKPVLLGNTCTKEESDVKY